MVVVAGGCLPMVGSGSLFSFISEVIHGSGLYSLLVACGGQWWTISVANYCIDCG